jgi:hypothetical protein
MSWITHRPPGIVAEVRQRVAKLVCKLKSILGPTGILGRQTYRDAAAWLTLEVGYRITRSMVDVDTRKLRTRTVSPNLARRGVQDGRDIRGTNVPKARKVDVNRGPSR